MFDDTIIFTIFLIFFGAAVVATLALFARQALLISYILLGAAMGPSALGWVGDPGVIKQMAHIGIMFLLFLMGLELNPRDLRTMLRKTTGITLISSLVFATAGFVLTLLMGFSGEAALITGATAMFSSTIIGLKLLPTTVLHHQRTGEVVIGILLMQDLLAILLLLFLKGGAADSSPWIEVAKLLIAMPVLIAVAVGFVRWVLLPLLANFDTIREYIFLTAIGWCLGMAELAVLMGFSHEIGAFIGGISLASSPVSLYIADSLKPLRDFFLVLFFFSLGAGFDLAMLPSVMLPAALLTLLMLVLKPPVFRWLLERSGETSERSIEIGWRLGQMSEFSLLVAVLALERIDIGRAAAYYIQLAALLSFIFSTYLVVLRFPTPIALNPDLRQD